MREGQPQDMAVEARWEGRNCMGNVHKARTLWALGKRLLNVCLRGFDCGSNPLRGAFPSQPSSRESFVRHGA